MKKKIQKKKKPASLRTNGKKRPVSLGTNKKKKALPGYPLYPEKEDIFANNKEVDIDLGKNTKVKRSTKNKNKFDSNLMGDETNSFDPQPNEELEHMVTDDDDSDDSNLNIDEQYDLGGEDE